MTRALVATSHVNLMEYPMVVRSFQKFPGDGSPASIGDSPKFPGDDPFLFFVFHAFNSTGSTLSPKIRKLPVDVSKNFNWFVSRIFFCYFFRQFHFCFIVA